VSAGSAFGADSFDGIPFDIAPFDCAQGRQGGQAGEDLSSRCPAWRAGLRGTAWSGCGLVDKRLLRLLSLRVPRSGL